MSCSAGGVAFPQLVEIFTSGPSHVASVDLSIVPDAVGRLFVWDVSISGGQLRVRWAVGRDGDPACCPSLDAVATFRLTDSGAVEAVSVDTVDESAAVSAIVDAVARRSRGDAARFADPDVVDTLFSFDDGTGLEIFQPCGGQLDYISSGVEIYDNRVCQMSIGGIVGVIGFSRNEFGNWRAVTVVLGD